MTSINPTFKLKIGKNPAFNVYLSDIRSKFRPWLLNKAPTWLNGQSNRATVGVFVKEALFAEIESKELTRLTVALIGDITKRRVDKVSTIQEFNSLFNK